MKVEYCDSMISKAFGFMFSFNPDKILVFRFDKEKIQRLHMFFVFCNLDVFFLDKNKRVVERTRLKPFSLYTSRKKAKYIIEVPKRYHNKISLNKLIKEKLQANLGGETGKFSAVDIESYRINMLRCLRESINSNYYSIKVTDNLKIIKSIIEKTIHAFHNGTEKEDIEKIFIKYI